ncbi:hypothetical protein PV08_12082 [Exophiala spinifera]|uniref:Uncharacterized protein n=1 Tax=Exophiala spinifera TaxID=91928 RepID=A0A0D1Z9M0_9EURO|nr:uncharacterized protein PV08_12082 [Exophiala spinifera]KIW09667.1 hypothetical protein PV08_12082 [Exophiala spinifera]
MSIIQSSKALQNAASLVHLHASDMVPVEGRSDILILDFRNRKELFTHELRNVVATYNKVDFVSIAEQERENGVNIEWRRYIEYACIFTPLNAQPTETLVAIVLPDLEGLTKDTIDTNVHPPTNAPKPLDTHRQSPAQQQLSGKPVSKENAVVSSERQEIHEGQAPQVGYILTAYGKGAIVPKPGGLTIVLIRYERKARLE